MAFRRSFGLLNKLAGGNVDHCVNGTFGLGTSGWTAATNTNIAVSANIMAVTASLANADGQVYQDVATVAGQIYLLKASVKVATGTAGGYLQVGNLKSDVFTDVTFTNHALAFIATGATTRIQLAAVQGTVGNTVDFQTVSFEHVSAGFRHILDKCFINVYSGTQPASANDAASGVLLYTLTNNADGVTGLTWDIPVNGSISKTPAELWRGVALAAGNAGWFRIYEAGSDPSIASTTAVRADGAISTSGSSELTMANVATDIGSIQSFTSFVYNQVS